MDTVEDVIGQVEISLRNEDIAQVRFGVRSRFRVSALTSPRGTIAIELSCTFEVTRSRPKRCRYLGQHISVLSTHLQAHFNVFAFNSVTLPRANRSTQTPFSA